MWFVTSLCLAIYPSRVFQLKNTKASWRLKSTGSRTTTQKHRNPNAESATIVSYHYCDVIMGAMASQVTSLTIVYSTVYSGADQIKHQSSASLAFVRRIQTVTGEFPAQMASNAENVSIGWHHHVNVNGDGIRHDVHVTSTNAKKTCNGLRSPRADYG